MATFFSLIVALLSAATCCAFPAANIARSVSFEFGAQKVRGVNIGGWLLLEPWITPSIFQKLNGPVDEYTLTEQLGSDAALSILQPHWETFVKLDDFERIAEAGFNTVRIPVGYWAFKKIDGDPFVQGAAPYIDTAIEWARSTNLKVWIDLHGAPGSQNGFDNSGQKTENIGFQQGGNEQHTLEVLAIISEKYAQPEYQDVVVAIELLNEPLGVKLDLDRLRQFTREGYGRVRDVSQDTTVAFSDAFEEVSTYNGFLTPSDNNAQNVLIDHHEYQVFDAQKIQWSHEEHISQVCNLRSAYSGSDKVVIVGEWSGAMTDCAPALNGYGIASRYEGLYDDSPHVGECGNINFIDTWDQALKDDTRRYIAAQMEAYECAAGGWIFWNFKTEASAEWDAFRLIDNGAFPDVNGVQCGTYCQ
ncbi:MAG: exo-1,3-beta-glucanase [Piccolia ochrophora]|nr:MAG: exo-1,3-beta-glucanase [Piccolia ochrophora]